MGKTRSKTDSSRRRRLFVGVDIGGTKSAVVLGHPDDSGGMCVADKAAFPTVGTPAAMLDQLAETASRLVKQAKATSVEAIGISCGGPLDSRKGLVQSPPNLPGWDNVPVVDILSKRLAAPAFLQNDANACAVAEWKWGAGRGCRNMVFLTFGTGMGAGLILDGRLYSGANDLAGEVGHVRLAPDGPRGFGKNGSFEGFCSGGGIAQLARTEVETRLARGEIVGFCADAEKAKELSARDVGEAAASGNPVAREILAQSGRYLGRGLAILIDVLNPERIVIGSIFARCREFLQPSMEEELQREALAPAAQVCCVVPAGLGETIGDYAALAVAVAGREGNVL
jgi:glucokinase